MGLWSSIKKAAKKVVSVVKTVVRTVVKVVAETVSRVINSLAEIFLYWKEKKVRIVVLILRDEMGFPLIDLNPNTLDPIKVALRTDLNEAINNVKTTFKDKMNIEVRPYGTEIQILKDSAPTAALGVRCDPTARGVGVAAGGAAIGGMLGILGGPPGIIIGAALGFGAGAAIAGGRSGGALSNEFSEAGSYFAKNTAGWGWLRMNFQFPITIFIVRDIEGKIGCSLGPLTDYVTIGTTPTTGPNPISGVSSEYNMAHELGHCCGLLFHSDDMKNLMYPDHGRDNNVKSWQKALVRTSRHCTFW
ncbi:MAG: hypothetical protein JNK91_04475 [Ferruginibacter sp.]|nr:hypothetical protein [Ferruginibacter sp.]